MNGVRMLYSDQDDNRGWRVMLAAFQVPRESGYLLDSVPVYLVTEQASRSVAPLAEFVHPERVTYVFGADRDGEPLVPPPGAVKVTIPTEYDLGLFASQAAAIVLYDRMVKTYAH